MGDSEVVQFQLLWNEAEYSFRNLLSFNPHFQECKVPIRQHRRVVPKTNMPKL